MKIVRKADSYVGLTSAAPGIDHPGDCATMTPPRKTTRGNGVRLLLLSETTADL